MGTSLEQAIADWIAKHAPAHKGHHVQVGGGGVLCSTCGLIDLIEQPDSVRDSEALAVA